MHHYQTESQYLSEVLTSYGKNMDSSLVDFYRERTNALKQFIADHYRTMLASPPIYSGSIHRSTDIITEFDVDIIVPFKKEAFKNQKSMLQKMNRFLSSEVMKELRNASQFRKQRVSGGVRFENIWGTREIWVDIVPGIEPRKGTYKSTGSLHLWDRKDRKVILTNVHKQWRYVRNSHSNANKVIRLLKILRQTNDRFPRVKSFVLGLIVAKAFRESKEEKPRGLFSQLKMVLQYIVDEVEEIHIQDPGNRKNVVSELISENKKTQLRRLCNRILREVDSDNNALRFYFPHN